MIFFGAETGNDEILKKWIREAHNPQRASGGLLHAWQNLISFLNIPLYGYPCRHAGAGHETN
jgi:hypothetical protein